MAVHAFEDLHSFRVGILDVFRLQTGQIMMVVERVRLFWIQTGSQIQQCFCFFPHDLGCVSADLGARDSVGLACGRALPRTRPSARVSSTFFPRVSRSSSSSGARDIDIVIGDVQGARVARGRERRCELTVRGQRAEREGPAGAGVADVAAALAVAAVVACFNCCWRRCRWRDSEALQAWECCLLAHGDDGGPTRLCIGKHESVHVDGLMQQSRASC